MHSSDTPARGAPRAPTTSRFLRAACALSILGTALLAGEALGYTKRHIFVTNRGGNNIIELDDQLNYVATWFNDNTLSVPNGMAFTPQGWLFVADTGHNRIVGYDANGTVAVSWDASPYTAAGVEALNFNAQGILYASANPGSGRVPVFNQTGTFVKNLVDAPEYLALGNVNFTLGGHVILADFSAQGRGVREIDQTTGAVIGSFGQELGLRQEDMAVDGADRIFVSHYSKNEVAVFNTARMLERTFTAPGLSSPTGIVITHDCRVIVASYNTAELYEFVHDGTFLRAVTVPGLSLPESLAIAGQALPGSFTTGNIEFVPACNLGGTGGAGGMGGTGGTGGNGGNGGMGGSTGTGGAGQGGAGGMAGTTVSSSSANAGGAGGTSGNGGAGAEPGDPGGCGCRVAGGSEGAPAALFLSLLGLCGRRRSSRRNPRR